jgi:hypothetical protein
MPNIETSGYDTALALGDTELEILSKVDSIVDQAVTAGSPQIAVRYGLALRGTQHVAGLALAKLLYELREHWDMFPTDSPFSEWAQYEMGISGQTYNKYIDGWERVINHPHLQNDPELQRRIMNKPWKGIILLNAAAKEDQISPEDFEEIGNAPNVAAIAEIRTRIRGSKKTKGKPALRIVLQKDGKLKVRLGGSPYKEKGYIMRDDDKETVALISRLESVGVIVEPAK